MKLLFENKRYIVSTFLTILMVFCTHLSGYANNAPVFKEGGRARRSVAENTAAGTTIGAPVAATDEDNDVLTYSLGGAEGSPFFSIDTDTGQLRTKAPLDYEAKNLYAFAVHANDGKGGRVAISVTIDVTDDDEMPPNTAPIFTDGVSTRRAIAENTASGQNIGTAVTATDTDTGDTLTYSLVGTDAAAFSIVRASGQLLTRAALDYEVKNAYSVTVSVSDGNGGSAAIDVAISVTDVNETPSFPTKTATLSVAENTVSGEAIGNPLQATDPDGDTLTYSLNRGDRFAFRIDPNTGQVRTHAALDFETKQIYNDLAIRATDSQGSFDAIFVTINVTDVNENRAPVFTDGATTTRTVAENTASGTNIGAAVAATDADTGDTLTYSLVGTDAAAFSIVRASGQLLTRAALDYEVKNAYSVTVSVSDGNGGSAAIDVAISVTDVNETPSFPTKTATLSVAENTVSGEAIGNPLQATDPDGDTLTYSLNRGDRFAFRIDPNTGQVRTHAALDFETKQVYNDLAIRATDSQGSFDAILVTITVTDVNENRAPVFTDGTTTTRAIAENTAAGQNIGAPIAATDSDKDGLTYTLGGTDAAAFRIVSTSGQLRTHAALDFAVKNAYSVTVSVSDGDGGSASIDVTISITDASENSAPVFTDGVSTTRTIPENTAFGTNIGAAVAATDPDNDVLTYSLGGTDASSFSIVRASGQLRTRAILDYETKNAYSVTVTASDGNGESTGIPVTITVTNVNEAPSFRGERITLSVAENTVSGEAIGDPFQATDPDGDTLTYSLYRGDRFSFRIDPNTGQLRTLAALDFETKPVYNDLAIRATDGEGRIDAILVTITVTNIVEVTDIIPLNVNERTPEVQDAILREVPGVDNADDVTVAHLAGISRLIIDSGDGSIRSLKSGDFSGLTALTTLYLYYHSISDISPLEDLTALTTLYLNDNSISDISPLKDLTALTNLNLDSNSISDISSLKDLIALTNLDLYRNSISDISSLQHLTALTNLNLYGNSISDISLLQHLTALTNLDLYGNSISNISPLEDLTSLRTLKLMGNPISDYGPLLRLKAAIEAAGNSLSIDNSPPVFTDDSTTRTIAENTASGENIGTAIAATDPDNDTLTYSLGGTDAASFSIVSTSGQLQTLAALDYETKSSYSVTVSVSDLIGWSDSITVTINITDGNEALPSFTDGSSTTRTIAENAASGESIGLPVAATDADGDTLTYMLGGDDAAAFSIVTTTGQLQTHAALDYETKSSYSVTVSAFDGRGGSNSITVTINVMEGNGNSENRAPVFSEGTDTTRTIVENTASGQNIGAPVAATDADTGDTLTYTLGGDDAAAFSIVTTTGQLQTRAALDYETKSSYSVTVSVSDSNGGSNSITVTINLLDVDELGFVPVQSRAPVARNAIIAALGGRVHGEAVTPELLASIRGLEIPSSAFGPAVTSARGGRGQVGAQGNQGVGGFAPSLPRTADGRSLTSRDFAGLTNLKRLTVVGTLIWGSRGALQDISFLSSVTSLEYLELSRNCIDDISALANLTNLKWLYLHANNISDISVLEDLTNLEYLELGINFITDVSALANLSKLKVLQLHGNPISDYTPLETLRDTHGVNSNLDLDNNSPTFNEGATTTRSIAENSNEGTNIGTPVTATDMDNDTLTYSLGNVDGTGFSFSLDGTDEAAFSIDSATGQLRVKGALDFETKHSYTVTVLVSDYNTTPTISSGGDEITVTISITDGPGAPSIQTPPELPDTTALLSNFPNPFNPETWIPYQLATPADVTLTIYDIRGVVVRELKLGHQAAGMYINRSRAIHWDGRNMFGEKVASGLYFYTFKAGDYAATRKLLIRK